ncbi:unnamed protein product, partial [Owenia fusiformis]
MLENIKDNESNKRFMKKIPSGALGATVLVAGVDFLEEPIAVFIRFSESRYVPELTEVDVPLKFAFVLLGPVDSQSAYKEVGRSMGTLFACKIFQRSILSAKTKYDILQGITSFMDDSTVLPAFGWDHTIRIEPPANISEKTWAYSFHNTHEVTHAEHGDPTLKRTGRIFGGLVNDIKRKAEYYVS